MNPYSSKHKDSALLWEGGRILHPWKHWEEVHTNAGKRKTQRCDYIPRSGGSEVETLWKASNRAAEAEMEVPGEIGLKMGSRGSGPDPRGWAGTYSQAGVCLESDRKDARETPGASVPQEGLGLCALVVLRLHPCADVRLALTLVPIPCTISLSEKLVFWGSQLLPARVAECSLSSWSLDSCALECLSLMCPGV